jgi:hypothetical protein
MIPLDIWKLILSFIPFHGSDWLNVLLTSKEFFVLGKEAFDPSKYHNRQLIWAIRAKNVSLIEIISDVEMH